MPQSWKPIELHQAANVLIQDKGAEGALEHIWERLNHFEATHNTEAYAVWRSILSAYGKLIQGEAGEGDTVQ